MSWQPLETVGTLAPTGDVGPVYLRAAPGVTTVPRSAVRVWVRGLLENRFAVLCVAMQGMLLVAAAPGYGAHGLQIDWRGAIPQVAVQGMLLFLWLHFRQYPGSARERILPDLILVSSLMIMLTNIASPAQYVAVALKRPLVDVWLARADALLGVHVPTLVRWTSSHPILSLLFTLSYFSLFPQFLLTLVLLGLLYQNRERLWEYAFHFHFCLIVTLSALAVFPAECAFQYYGFQSTINQTHFIAHFQALRNGTFHTLMFADLEGLISMPSFHVAGALMVTWAFRGYRRVLVPLVVLNTGLIAATFMSGAHYFVDVLASCLLFAVSVVMFRRWGVLLLDSPERTVLAPLSVDAGTRG